MGKKIISTENAPEAVGTYSQAVSFENFIFTSGQIPINPMSGKIINGTFKDRVRQVLNNIEAILLESDSSLFNILKFTVYLTDLSRFSELNEVFLETFPKDPPARSSVEVCNLPLDSDIEIDCIAIKKEQ
ncbi:MAG: reactive intermediate/imine deaminase [Candidatus Marinimicrobia bacterium]|nr:reactive intermediate/imine deaminase [Candidatus Neomarinimicrobiota bacterium]|tara:strand:- start:2838 stop:3227 length:390 start_codon:yes stop_codon:yes gene_type:complete